MTIDEIAQGAPAWLSAPCAFDEIVISSRIRLARNICPHLFVHRNNPHGLAQILQEATTAVNESGVFKEGLSLTMADLADIDRMLLVERHLVSPNFVGTDTARGLFVGEHEKLSLMVNEEDHLRLQTLEAGLDLLSTWHTLSRIDDELNRHLYYAYDERLGYLTTCPTNTGTGLRASILIHLPALVLTREIDKVLRGITQVGLTVRGMYGEGSDVIGNLFQISNQTTLGQSENEIISSIEQIVKQIIAYEQKARETLMHDAKVPLEDKIWRAYGMLCNARILSSREFLNLSSVVRLGVNAGVVEQVSLQTLNTLLIQTRPAHMQKMAGSSIAAAERDQLRATFVRTAFLK